MQKCAQQAMFCCAWSCSCSIQLSPQWAQSLHKLNFDSGPCHQLKFWSCGCEVLQHLVSGIIGQLTNQLASQPTNQPANQLTNQTTD